MHQAEVHCIMPSNSKLKVQLIVEDKKDKVNLNMEFSLNNETDTKKCCQSS